MDELVFITLEHGEHIMAVVPQRAAGPGWANSPAWVYIQRSDGTLRTECIQPEERSPALHALYDAGEAMCAALRHAVPVKRKE